MWWPAREGGTTWGGFGERESAPDDAEPHERPGWLPLLIVLEVVACVVGILTGALLVYIAGIYEGTWVPAIAIALIVLSPANLALTLTLAHLGRVRDGRRWLRRGLFAVKCALSLAMVPLMLLSVVLVVLPLVVIWAIAQASGGAGSL